MTPKQCRRARKLLGLTQGALARALNIQDYDIGRYERVGRVPMVRNGTDPIGAIRAALEEAGVVFTDGEEPGVKLRKAEP